MKAYNVAVSFNHKYINQAGNLTGLASINFIFSFTTSAPNTPTISKYFMTYTESDYAIGPNNQPIQVVRGQGFLFGSDMGNMDDILTSIEEPIKNLVNAVPIPISFTPPRQPRHHNFSGRRLVSRNQTRHRDESRHRESSRHKSRSRARDDLDTSRGNPYTLSPFDYHVTNTTNAPDILTSLTSALALPLSEVDDPAIKMVIIAVEAAMALVVYNWLVTFVGSSFNLIGTLAAVYIILHVSRAAQPQASVMR